MDENHRLGVLELDPFCLLGVSKIIYILNFSIWYLLGLLSMMPDPEFIQIGNYFFCQITTCNCRNLWFDKFCIKIFILFFLADDICWFAVYDGHAGSRVSYHCSNHLLESISTSDEFRDALKNENDLGEEELMEKVKGGVLQGFLELDEKLR